MIHRYTVDRYIILSSSKASRNMVIIFFKVKWATKDLDNHIKVRLYDTKKDKEVWATSE